jgi:hypothetical protein
VKKLAVSDAEPCGTHKVKGRTSTDQPGDEMPEWYHPHVERSIMGSIDAKVWSTCLLVVLVILLFVVFYPFQIRIAPDWVARVVDENGHPVVQAEVLENWQEYSIEEVSHEENKSTALDGIVRFQPRTLRASIASRVGGCAHNFQKLGVHASCGASAHLVAYKCNYGFLLTDVGRTKGDSWLGWSKHMDAIILLRHCPPGSSGVGCLSDEEMHNRACLNESEK